MEELLSKATPRPWHVGVTMSSTFGQYWPVLRLSQMRGNNLDELLEEAKANAELVEELVNNVEAQIAALREQVAEMTEDAEELQAHNKELYSLLSEAFDYIMEGHPTGAELEALIGRIEVAFERGM